MFGALATGETVIAGLLESDDVLATANALIVREPFAAAAAAGDACRVIRLR